jgi:hypothetical protein
LSVSSILLATPVLELGKNFTLFYQGKSEPSALFLAKRVYLVTEHSFGMAPLM